MKKIKKIAKYLTNILGAISMLIVGIDAIEEISIPYAFQIVKVIAVVQGVLGTYLLSSNKEHNATSFIEEVEDELNTSEETNI